MLRPFGVFFIMKTNKGIVGISLLVIGTLLLTLGGISLVRNNPDLTSIRKQIAEQNKIIEAQSFSLKQQDQYISDQESKYNNFLISTINLGAFRPSNYVGKLLTRLAEGGAESTFNTTPDEAADGSSLSTARMGDFIVFTINPGGANEEKISVSNVSTSSDVATWTIINRGLSYTENASVTANINQHAIGETVIISNDDQIYSSVRSKKS